MRWVLRTLTLSLFASSMGAYFFLLILYVAIFFEIDSEYPLGYFLASLIAGDLTGFLVGVRFQERLWFHLTAVIVCSLHLWILSDSVGSYLAFTLEYNEAQGFLESLRLGIGTVVQKAIIIGIVVHWLVCLYVSLVVNTIIVERRRRRSNQSIAPIS